MIKLKNNVGELSSTTSSTPTSKWQKGGSHLLFLCVNAESVRKTRHFWMKGSCHLNYEQMYVIIIAN